MRRRVQQKQKQKQKPWKNKMADNGKLQCMLLNVCVDV